jgi:hypothetical protein
MVFDLNQGSWESGYCGETIYLYLLYKYMLPYAIHLISYNYPEKLRINDWPTSLAGKGHDTGVVCRWLAHFLRNTDP